VNDIPIEFEVTDYLEFTSNIKSAEFYVTKAAASGRKQVSCQVINKDRLIHTVGTIKVTPDKDLFKEKGEYCGTIVLTYNDGKCIGSYPIFIKVYENAGEEV
jgi:hypothetical protein